MVVVFGTRLLGETDAVPGVFSVATKFFHVDFLPLVPLGSYIVLKRRFRSFQGIEIPLSGKSIAVAWLRAIGVIAALITGVFSFATYSDEGFSATFATLFGSFLLASAVASFLVCHGYTRNASYERASELASKLGPAAGPVVQRLVDAHFGKIAFVAVEVEEDNDNLDAPLEMSGNDDLEPGEVMESSEALPIAVPVESNESNCKVTNSAPLGASDKV